MGTGGHADSGMMGASLAAQAQAMGRAANAANLSQDIANTGQGYQQQYYVPLMNAFRQMLNLGGTGPGTAQTPAGQQYFDPMMSLLMGNANLAVSQASDRAKRNVLESGVLGPVAQQMTMQDIDQQSIAARQQNALNSINTAIQGLTQTGQLGAQMLGQGPSGLLGSASVFQGASQSYQNIAQMEMYAQQQQNQGLLAGIRGISTIAGMILGGPIGGQIGSAVGGMLGNAAGGGGMTGNSAGMVSNFASPLQSWL